jgi:hypothetical protein
VFAVGCGRLTLGVEVVPVALASEQPWWPYSLWGTVGALIGLGVVGILSIGIFALGVALLLALIGVVIRASRSVAVVGMVPGLGVLPLIVGLSNLGGPGERCSSTANSLSCSELLSPWPFLVPGLVLVVAGCWLVWRIRAAETAPTGV